MLRNLGGMNVVREKDYIGNPKPNGYRSYHMIVQLPVGANLVFARDTDTHHCDGLLGKSRARSAL